MRYIIFVCIIQYLSYLTSRVESLTGKRILTADDGEFPYIASIQNYPGGQSFCTGVLITEKDILTVAHCIENRIPEKIQIVFEVSLEPADLPTFSVDSWLTYDEWADRSGIKKEPLVHDIAIIKLSGCRVDQTIIKPVSLSKWHKKHIQGKKVTITGWNRTVGQNQLKKASVDLLSDEDCVNKVRLIANRNLLFGPRLMCTIATPHVLLQSGDSGAALLDTDNHLYGVNVGTCPYSQCAYANFSEEFLNQYQINVHMSVHYYRYFIFSVTQINI